MKREELINDLRALASLYESNPDLPLPCSQRFDVFLFGEDAKTQMRDAAKILAPVRKDATIDFLYVIKEFSGAIQLHINADREQVCTKRVVGVERVPEQVIEAYDREVIEWDCEPIMEQA